LVFGLHAATHQSRYQAQQGVVLWVSRPARQKGADVEIGYLTAGWCIRFMPDEYSLGLGIPA
jgi:hypothetical protein